MAEYRIEPWGERHAEILNAYAMAQYAEAHRDEKKRRESFGIADFLLYSDGRRSVQSVELTPEQYLAAIGGRPGVVDKRKRKKKRKRR
jgi:hypothetical protein